MKFVGSQSVYQVIGSCSTINILTLTDNVKGLEGSEGDMKMLFPNKTYPSFPQLVAYKKDFGTVNT